jgi:hypothetical protein
LPAYLSPVYNPDLFWHLSAGRWILEHHALPRADWLSFLKPSAPWLDFEWLSQLVFESAWRGGGFRALWLLKGFLLLGVWLVIDAALREKRAAPGSRLAGLLLWSTAALMHADLRPELFSLLFFALIFLMLESVREARLQPRPAHLVWLLALFALWSSLHAGFSLALGALALYAAAGAVPLSWLAAAGLGSLCNPYGAGPYRVAWIHLRLSPQISKLIMEWRPMSFENPAYWGFWLLLALWLAAGVSRFRRRGSLREALPWVLSAGLALAGLQHERAGSYFLLAAVVLVCAEAEHARFGRRALLAAAAACAAFSVWIAPRAVKAEVFSDRFVPRVAAEFISREQAVFESLRVYHPMEWGGYLGWRLSPWFKIFADGRYIFHDELPLENAAVAEPEAWRRYLSERRVDAVLLENLAKSFPSTRVYPDGTSKTFQRPYYLSYEPARDWALVHWDEKALIFARRSAVPAAWLAAHEFHWVRPHDDAAFADAMSRGELPKEKVAAESLRWQEEARSLARVLP